MKHSPEGMEQMREAGAAQGLMIMVTGNQIQTMALRGMRNPWLGGALSR